MNPEELEYLAGIMRSENARLSITKKVLQDARDAVARAEADYRIAEEARNKISTILYNIDPKWQDKVKTNFWNNY